VVALDSSKFQVNYIILVLLDIKSTAGKIEQSKIVFMCTFGQQSVDIATAMNAAIYFTQNLSVFMKIDNLIEYTDGGKLIQNDENKDIYFLYLFSVVLQCLISETNSIISESVIKSSKSCDDEKLENILVHLKSIMIR
jgi:hypothetical protein